MNIPKNWTTSKKRKMIHYYREWAAGVRKDYPFVRDSNRPLKKSEKEIIDRFWCYADHSGFLTMLKAWSPI